VLWNVKTSGSDGELSVAFEPPSMHDGSIPTLDAVLDHYAAGGRTPNPARSSGLKRFTLAVDERRDLIAFLESLTDDAAARSAMERPVAVARSVGVVEAEDPG
jgi:cytochrome c peroxidase